MVGKRRATYADLEKLPENLVGELIDGELFASPRPRSPHIVTSSVMGADLVGPFQLGRGGPGGWWILDEPELHLRGDVLVPDLAGWRRERMPKPPADHRFEIPPDWVCEVLSPSTAKLDRKLKMPVYARFEIPHVWVVDPLNRVVETWGLKNGMYLPAGNYVGDEKARMVPFDAIEIDLAVWWQTS